MSGSGGDSGGGGGSGGNGGNGGGGGGGAKAAAEATVVFRPSEAGEDEMDGPPDLCDASEEEDDAAAEVPEILEAEGGSHGSEFDHHQQEVRANRHMHEHMTTCMHEVNRRCTLHTHAMTYASVDLELVVYRRPQREAPAT